MPNYDIVILSYNHPELTAKTVRSVLELGFPDQQITLVHNGSEEKHAHLLTEEFRDIKHIFLKENKGFTGGANFGLSQAFATCENALFLTNDTEAISLPAYFPQNFDLFSILILKRHSTLVDSMIGQINLRTGTLKHIRRPEDLIVKDYLKVYIPGTAFGINRNAFQKLNGFDESYHTYWEDVDLSLRAQQKNLRLGYTLEFQVKHKIGKTCHKHRFYTLYLFQRNKKRLLSQYAENHLLCRLHFYWGMLRLVGRLLKQPQKKVNLTFWWKAICD